MKYKKIPSLNKSTTREKVYFINFYIYTYKLLNMWDDLHINKKYIVNIRIWMSHIFTIIL